MSRAWTEEEIKEKFIHHIHDMIDYWAGGKGSNVPADYDARRRMEGLMHSVLAMIDGDSMGLPGFHVIPCPHPDDKRYHEEEGTNYFPPCDIKDEVDIAGSLHEELWIDHTFGAKEF